MSELEKTELPFKSIETYLNNFDIEGRQLYKHNKNYKDIANMMEHPMFRDFFDRHLSSPLDRETMMKVLSVYKDIESASPVELNGYQKLAILDRIMKDGYFRQRIFHKNDSVREILN